MADNLIATARHLDREDHEQPEPFRVESDILWPDFKAVVIAQYENPPDDVIIKYTDEDNDMIIMSSQEELTEAMRTSVDNGGIMQLEVKGIKKTEGAKKKKASPAPVTQIDATLILPAIPRNKAPRTLPLITVNSSSNQPTTSEMAEPADMRETGEITPNSDRDQETGLYLTKNIPEREEVQDLETDSNSASSVDQPIETENNSSHTDYERMTGANLPQVPADDSMPYQTFVQFMEKLKQELRNEIVHDVTKKTVKQVLRGLDHTSNRLEDSGPWGIRKTDLRHVHPVYHHEGVSCKNCQKYILGARYKCGNCVDYDLCEKCESKYGIHSSDHVFIKLRRPCRDNLYRDSKKSPLLKRVLYKPDSMIELQESSTERKQEKMKKKVEKMFEKEKRKEEKLKRKLEKYDGLKDSPKKRERYELNHSPLLHHIKFCNKEYVTLGAAFIRDITIPDGTTVQPGTKMLKAWRLLNTGTCNWRKTTTLRLMYGTIPAIKTEVAVPCLKPGEEGDVTAELMAPELPGRYQSHWKLFDKGIAFGHRVWVTINVVPREILEPKPVEPLRVVEVNTEEEATEIPRAAEAPEEQRVERDVEIVTTTTQSPMPLYRLIPSMLDQVDDAQEQDIVETHEEEQVEAIVQNILHIVDTQPSPINDLNKLNSTDSSTKIESLNVDVAETDDKVEMNLSSAVAAMEKLTVSEVRTTQATNVGNDLLSFEFLDRTPPKQSQTATPSNTPLDVSPPKSPVPTRRLETVLSASSSMELVNGDLDECVPLLGEYPHERIQSLEFKQGTGYIEEDDIESLLSYSDSDSSSSDDFFVVPLPDCFDTSIPLTRSLLLQPGDVDENQNEVQSSQPSVDDLLQASTSDDARPLTPEVTAPEIPRDVPDVQAVAISSLDIIEAVPSISHMVPDIIPEIPRDVSILMPVTCDEIPRSEASCVVTQTTTIVQTSSDGAVGSESVETQMDSSCYAAASGRPLTDAEHQTQVLAVANGGSQSAVESTQVNSSDASATAGGNAEQQEFAKQLFDVAITTAANAASNAYFKVKEVIHTWQAKDLERQQQTQQQQQIAQNIKVNKGWVPPKQEFKMPKNDWTPPEDTYKPPEDDYVPPQSTWTPPSTNYEPPTSEAARVERSPMDQLMSMGFCNRELNKEVLKKSNDEVSKAISLILEMNQEDWAATRY